MGEAPGGKRARSRRYLTSRDRTRKWGPRVARPMARSGDRGNRSGAAFFIPNSALPHSECQCMTVPPITLMA